MKTRIDRNFLKMRANSRSGPEFLEIKSNENKWKLMKRNEHRFSDFQNFSILKSNGN